MLPLLDRERFMLHAALMPTTPVAAERPAMKASLGEHAPRSRGTATA